MTTVHPTAAAGWRSRGAEDYERGRPGYPRAAVELIGAELGIGPGAVILDLAAGTGKLTRELSVLGADVVAVEPLPAMRSELTAALPDVDVRDGTAEAIPWPDGSLAAVTVAQAFHWFDVPSAAAEIARVLVPDGGLAILRNEWLRDGWGADLRAYIGEARSAPDNHGRDWLSELRQTGRFGPFSEATVDNDQRSDLDGLLARVASMSFIAALPDDDRARVLAGAEALLRDRGLRPGVEIAVPTRTVVRWARRA